VRELNKTGRKKSKIGVAGWGKGKTEQRKSDSGSEERFLSFFFWGGGGMVLGSPSRVLGVSLGKRVGGIGIHEFPPMPPVLVFFTRFFVVYGYVESCRVLWVYEL
jgi:hypothetical protein